MLLIAQKLMGSGLLSKTGISSSTQLRKLWKLSMRKLVIMGRSRYLRMERLPGMALEAYTTLQVGTMKANGTTVFGMEEELKNSKVSIPTKVNTTKGKPMVEVHTNGETAKYTQENGKKVFVMGKGNG